MAKDASDSVVEDDDLPLDVKDALAAMDWDGRLAEAREKRAQFLAGKTEPETPTPPAANTPAKPVTAAHLPDADDAFWADGAHEDGTQGDEASTPIAAIKAPVKKAPKAVATPPAFARSLKPKPLVLTPVEEDFPEFDSLTGLKDHDDSLKKFPVGAALPIAAAAQANPTPTADENPTKRRALVVPVVFALALGIGLGIGLTIGQFGMQRPDAVASALPASAAQALPEPAPEIGLIALAGMALTSGNVSDAPDLQLAGLATPVMPPVPNAATLPALASTPQSTLFTPEPTHAALVTVTSTMPALGTALPETPSEIVQLVALSPKALHAPGGLSLPSAAPAASPAIYVPQALTAPVIAIPDIYLDLSTPDGESDLATISLALATPTIAHTQPRAFNVTPASREAQSAIATQNNVQPLSVLVAAPKQINRPQTSRLALATSALAPQIKPVRLAALSAPAYNASALPIFAPPPPAKPTLAQKHDLSPDQVARVRLFLNAPNGVDDNDFAALNTRLQATEFTLVKSNRLPLKITQNQVRYYHDSDAAAAQALAAFSDGTLRDFTSFSPKPANGTIEVWMSGPSSTATAVAAAPVRKASVKRATRATPRKARVKRAAPKRSAASQRIQLRNKLVNSLRRGDHL